MSPTRQRVLDDIKSAMKAGDKPRLAVLRSVSAAFKQREIDERTELDEPAVTAILDKLVKQRRESISQYENAGRDDLVAVEANELAVLQDYLPEQLDEAGIDAAVDEAVASTGASSVRDMGKVMGTLKPALQGRADMSVVSARVKARLGA